VLHQYPEVSTEEVKTQERIISFLEEMGLTTIQKIGHTGVLCTFDSGKPGKKILLRADTDALPIQEINDFPHASTISGVSHKCGHDGHTAIMCGVTKALTIAPILSGSVHLLFQPAEENGEGAKAVLADKNFDFEPDYVFALHNLPGYELHEIVCREGSFTAAAKSIIIKLSGKTSHAAEPELGINPASAIGALISMFEEVSNTDVTASDFALATPIYIQMGELAYGVSAGAGEVHYTLRTWKNEVMDRFTKEIISITEQIAKQNKLNYTIEFTQEFASNQNDKEAVEQITAAAKINELKFIERPYPFKWGEDFGLFTEKYKGAMFGIGSGSNCPALHNPDYDFPDEIIPTGISMFTSIIKNILK
jgi:amidohydrolase